MPLKNVVITGACGQIGSEFTKTLLKLGYEVYALDIKENIFSFHKRLHYVRLDITDEQEVVNFYRGLKKVDLLVNNAGIGVYTPVEQRTAQEFMQVINVNLLGNFLMTRESLKKMKKSGGGKIINLGTIYGVVSSDYRIYGKSKRNNSEVYSATKAGVIQMTKYFACHYAKFNIQVNCISPGGIYNRQKKEFVSSYCNRNPSGRMGIPKDLVGVFKFLLSEESNYINGQNILVDGGYTSW